MASCHLVVPRGPRHCGVSVTPWWNEAIINVTSLLFLLRRVKMFAVKKVCALTHKKNSVYIHVHQIFNPYFIVAG